jgi:RNA polymerase sigma-70 factor, ECF subfamily
VVAGAANQIMEAGAFTSEDNYGVGREVVLVVILRASFVESDAPDVALFQRLKGPDHIHDSRDAQVLCRAGRRLYSDRAEGGRAAFRKQNPVYSSGLGGAQQGAQVLRVFDTVEREDQTSLGTIEEVFETQKLALADDRHHSLMIGGARQPSQGFPGLLTRFDAGLPAKLKDPGEPLVVALASKANVFDGPRAGSQRFFHRVQAVEEFHSLPSKHQFIPLRSHGMWWIIRKLEVSWALEPASKRMDLSVRLEKLVVGSVFQRRMFVSESEIDMSTAALQLAQEVSRENALVAEGLKRHDPKVLDGLILQYQHRLLRYLLFLTGNREMAEDLFQETWMRVLVRGAQFNGNSRFDTWLFTIARNLVIDLRRRKSMASLEEMCESGDDDRPFEVPSQEKSPFDHLATLENGQMVAEALLTLDPLHREVLVLRFHEELSLEEIARVTRAPLSTVKSRLYRGLAAIRPRVEAVTGHTGPNAK